MSFTILLLFIPMVIPPLASQYFVFSTIYFSLALAKDTSYYKGRDPFDFFFFSSYIWYVIYMVLLNIGDILLLFWRLGYQQHVIRRNFLIILTYLFVFANVLLMARSSIYQRIDGVYLGTIGHINLSHEVIKYWFALSVPIFAWTSNVWYVWTPCISW